MALVNFNSLEITTSEDEKKLPDDFTTELNNRIN